MTRTHRRASLPLLAVSLLGCAQPVRSSVPALAAEQAAADPAVRVTVSVENDGLRARFTLAEATRELGFAATQHVRRDGWKVLTPGLTLADDRLHADADFAEFELAISPDAQEHDRAFPALTRVGEGFVLYGPALLIEGVETTASFALADGQVAWPSAAADDGYVYLGPEAVVERDGFRLVGADTVAPWLARTIEAQVSASLSFYAEALDLPTRAPTLFVSGDAPGPMSFHGDVTPNSVIFLRFHGDDWAEPDERRSVLVGKFVRHEAFHLWNRGTAPGTPPWLHEGGAEYAAIVATVQAKELTQAQGLEQISHALTRCRRALGDRPMGELEARGSAVYDCGVALEWVADVDARHGSGDRHIFSLWTELLATADGDGYAVADFRDLAGPLVELLLDAEVTDRWGALARELAARGVEFSDTPSDGDYREAVIGHLLAQACEGDKRGFWTEADHVRLDTGDRCGPLTHELAVVAIEGHELFGEADAAFEAVHERCAASAAVELEARDGSEYAVDCRALPGRPEVFVLRSAPPLELSLSE